MIEGERSMLEGLLYRDTICNDKYIERLATTSDSFRKKLTIGSIITILTIGAAFYTHPPRFPEIDTYLQKYFNLSENSDKEEKQKDQKECKIYSDCMYA